MDIYYNLGLAESLAENKEIFLDLVDDLDSVLSTQKQFLFWVWLESAKMITQNPEEKSLYEFNACNQVTLWGPDGQILDYAAKQWSGLISQYYGKRWELFFDTLALNLQQCVSFTYKTNFDI